MSHLGHNFLQEDIEGKTAFHWTVDNPTTDCIEALLNTQPEILNKQDGEGTSLLHIACEYNLSHIVLNLLHNRGLLIDSRDSYGRSSLHYAAISGAGVLVEALLSQKALDSVFDAEGLTALHYAVKYQHLDCVNAFLLQELPSHLPDHDFRTPLMYASVLGNVKILNALLSHVEIAAQINTGDNQENNCLLYTLLSTQSLEIMRILLQIGADANILNATGFNALHICCQTNNLEAALLLIQFNASVLIPDRQDMLSPLLMAVRHCSADVLKLLAVHPQCVNVVTQDGLNALHFTAQMGEKALVEILLNSPLKGTLLNATDAAGLAPIHHAILKGNTEIVHLFCEYGAYLHLQLVDFNFDTCLDLAINNRQLEIVDVLKKNYALTNHELLTNAAIIIQSYVRCFLAKIRLALLKTFASAVTVISANFRAFHARLYYKDLKLRNSNATVIQAFFRGYLQRKHFLHDLAKFREIRMHNLYIDSINYIYLANIKTCQIGTFTAKDLDFSDSLIISPWRSSLRRKQQESYEEQAKRFENEHRIVLENSLLLRRKLEENKCVWIEFLQRELERRRDKFLFKKRQENLDIVQRSRQRRITITEQYYLIKNLQQKVHSALIIQRTVRQWMRLRCRRKRDNYIEEMRFISREKAARIIQKNWRCHLYDVMQRELKETAEVLETNINYPHAIFCTNQSAPLLLKRTKSYQSDTLLTLMPRRKLLMPPSREVLIEAKKDCLALSLPERNIVALKEISRANNTVSVGNLRQHTILPILGTNETSIENKKRLVLYTKVEGSLSDNIHIFIPNEMSSENTRMNLNTTPLWSSVHNRDNVLPIVSSEKSYSKNKQSPNFNISKCYVSSLPIILKK